MQFFSIPDIKTISPELRGLISDSQPYCSHAYSSRQDFHTCHSDTKHLLKGRDALQVESNGSLKLGLLQSL